MSRLFFVTIISLVFVTTCAAKTHESPPPIGKPEIKLTSGNSGIFDLQTMEFIANRAGIAAFNISVQGHPDGTPSFAAIVSRLHAINPKLPVLMYSYGTIWTTSGHTIATTLGAGYQSLGPALLPSKFRENPRRRGKRARYYGNPASKHFRQWMIVRIKHYLEVTGADGVNLDNMFRTPSWLRRYCKNKEPECAEYHNGMREYLTETKKAIAPKLVYFNGLWNAWPGLLATQKKLLPFADGAFIEFFGRRKSGPVPPFSHSIAPYLSIIASNPDKGFLVNGRGTQAEYRSYEDDYLWQRYLYAAYLLVAGPRTHFHYNVRFTVPSPGRANGLSWYEDWNSPLGAPLGPYSNRSGLYVRRFTQALVLLVPSDAEHSEHYALSGKWYTSEGKIVSGTIIVNPGEGLVLTRARHKAKAITIGFSGNEPPGSDWQGAAIKKDPSSGKYLALHAPPAGDVWRHDLMLDFTHSLSAPRCVHLRVRSKDASLRFLLVAAVDDAKARAERVVIELFPKGTNAQFGRKLAIWFRDPRPHGRHMPYIAAQTPLIIDGKWHETSVCAASAFSKQSRYSFAQWKYLRILGTVNIASVRLDNNEQRN